MDKNWNVSIEKAETKVNGIISNIEHFQKEHWYTVASNIQLFDGKLAKIFYSGGSFHFEIGLVERVHPDEITSIMNNLTIWFEFSNDRRKLHASYSSFKSFTTNYALVHGYLVVKGTFKQLTSMGETIKKHKYIATVGCKDNNFLGSYFPAKNLKVGSTTFAARITEINLNGYAFQIFLYGRRNVSEQYLFVESLCEIDYTEFTTIIHEVFLVLAFITGSFVDKQIYILDQFDSQREVVSVLVYPEDVKSAAFSAIPKINDTIAEHTQLQLKFGLISLARMIETSIQSASFRRTLLLMLKANSQPDYTRVVLYSVALEAIAKLIHEENEEAMRLITDKTLGKEIRGKLKGVIKEYENRIDDVSFRKLNGRIENITSPSNYDTLTKPFSIYNIPLQDSDLRAINNRNDFLHGELSYEVGSHELAIAGLRLNYCVNTLIMKYVGYSGAILYQPYFYQLHHKLAVDCKPFQLI